MLSLVISSTAPPELYTNEERFMKKLIAAVVASVFALGSLSTFAAGTVRDHRDQTTAQHSVVHKAQKAKGAKFHHVKHNKKAKKHHARKIHRSV
jgi:hypothetical protein